MARSLPPLYALRAFEAAARHSSFTRAGEELSITQSAVSRHIKTLEAHFACRLFQRSGRSLMVYVLVVAAMAVAWLLDKRQNEIMAAQDSGSGDSEKNNQDDRESVCSGGGGGGGAGGGGAASTTGSSDGESFSSSSDMI